MAGRNSKRPPAKKSATKQPTPAPTVPATPQPAPPDDTSAAPAATVTLDRTRDSR